MVPSSDLAGPHCLCPRPRRTGLSLTTVPPGAALCPPLLLSSSCSLLTCPRPLSWAASSCLDRLRSPGPSEGPPGACRELGGSLALTGDGLKRGGCAGHQQLGRCCLQHHPWYSQEPTECPSVPYHLSVSPQPTSQVPLSPSGSEEASSERLRSSLKRLSAQWKRLSAELSAPSASWELSRLGPDSGSDGLGLRWISWS